MKKLIKLSKILKKFSLEDLLTYINEDPEDLEQKLEQLIKDNVISKLSNNEYVYMSGYNTQIASTIHLGDLNVNREELLSLKNIADVTNIDPSEIFYSPKDIKYFNLCTPIIKQRILKALIVFILTEKFSINETYCFMQKLKKEKSPYAMNKYPSRMSGDGELSLFVLLELLRCIDLYHRYLLQQSRFHLSYIANQRM